MHLRMDHSHHIRRGLVSQWKFSLYFMGTVPEGVTIPEDVASKEAQDQCFRWEGVLLELTQCVFTLLCPACSMPRSGE